MKQSNPPEEGPPAGPLYPELPEVRPASPQTFRLQKISEQETFLRAEVERRSHLNKKYRRAVNTIYGTCAALGAACIVTGAAGAGLLASGIGFVPGIALEVVTGLAGLFDVAGVAVSRRRSAKAAKHEAVRVLATSKLNTVYIHISKALEDCIISDDEYRLVLEEVEKYRTMKEELRHKSAAAGSVVDEETKNSLIQRGRDEGRACFAETIKNSWLQSLIHPELCVRVRGLRVVKLQILLDPLHLRHMNNTSFSLPSARHTAAAVYFNQSLSSAFHSCLLPCCVSNVHLMCS